MLFEIGRWIRTAAIGDNDAELSEVNIAPAHLPAKIRQAFFTQEHVSKYWFPVYIFSGYAFQHVLIFIERFLHRDTPALFTLSSSFLTPS